MGFAGYTQLRKRNLTKKLGKESFNLLVVEIVAAYRHQLCRCMSNISKGLLVLKLCARFRKNRQLV